MSAATLRKVERAAGGLATRSVALMDERLPWFRTLPPHQRSWVTLVAQAGISGYVSWAYGLGGARLTDQVFGTAPRDLVRAVSLRRTVELVRVAITVAEEHLPAARPGSGRAGRAAGLVAALQPRGRLRRSGGVRGGRRNRGAWDARVEAAVVDGIVRGEDPLSLTSRAAALDWDAGAEVVVVVGRPASASRRRSSPMPPNGPNAGDGRRWPACTAADWCSSSAVATSPTSRSPTLFGDGPVVRGPVATGLSGAVASAADALAALDVAGAWPAAPRPV